MEKSPLVSVIVPNYNHSKYLDERLSSILGQTYRNFEIIILDDCSTDNSVEIINHYHNEQKVSHVVINDTNSGSPFKQWKKGFKLAKGDLIWIAESDDSCKLDFLETLVNEFEKEDNCILAFCASEIISGSGQIISETHPYNSSMLISGKQFINKYLSRYNYISNASSALFAKKVLINIDDNYTQFRGCGDWIFWTEIAKNGNVAYIDIPLNRFRQHGRNTTNQQTNSVRGAYEIIKVTKFLRKKHYIDYFYYFRAKIVNVYSIRYGKSRFLFTREQIDEIQKEWGWDFFSSFTIKILFYANKAGIKLNKR